MAEMALLKDVGGTGLPIKRILTIGVSGGLTIGVSDYWVEKYFEGDTDEKSRERKRAALQVAAGVGAAYLLRRWSRDAAVGAAAGGIVGGTIRIWESEDMGSKMADWFGSDSDSSSSSSSGSGTGTGSGSGSGTSAGAVYGERVVVSDPRGRRTVNG